MRRVLRILAVGALLLGLAAWLAVPKYLQAQRALREQALDRLEGACKDKKDPRCLKGFSSFCEEGLPRACRRVAQAHACGRGTAPSREVAASGYAKACGMGDGLSCGELASNHLARMDQEGRVPVPHPEMDAVKLRVLHYASRYADGRGDALRGAWGWTKPATPELLFLDAAVALDRGRGPEAEALLRALREREGSDPAVRTLDAYRGELDKGARPGLETLIRAWKESGSPDLRGNRFLPLSPYRFDDQWACSLDLDGPPVAPSEDPGAGDGAFLRAVGRWPRSLPLSERLLQAAADRAASADPHLAWIAASVLTWENVPEASRARTEALLSKTVPRLARQLPGVPELVVWQRVRDRAFGAEAIAADASRGIAWAEVYRLFLDAHRAADPLEARARARIATSVLEFDTTPVEKYVEGVLEAAAAQDLEVRARSARHLAELAEALARHGPWRHVRRSAWLLWKAQELSGDASYEARWQVQQEREARIDTPEGLFPLMGRWPLRAVSLDFAEGSAHDEIGFYERLYEDGAR